ncbi:hypothetical protein PtA15_8A162 [Puccinia triticina]|uniref:Uncharacterized protein n=1 Tax=Puccinia triticina TaxID=208348 RepID=A0ABY7CQP2_9BASI|nr:uncharacterized protein PtA15_8A162 [Puccinia triticina]WAQ87258.1 hypothetical protein PtA15_8A162 [Puccinia triticina]
MAKGYFHSHQTNPSQWKIAIQPGYRTVNIGRTSNPLPILIPNVFARRPCQSHPKTNSSSSSHSKSSSGGPSLGTAAIGMSDEYLLT